MTAESKYKKLVKNSVVFFIGNLGSKVITFLIVPFYTYYLTTAEYGTADLVTTTVNLLVPFAMVGMNEAVLRFTVSKEVDVKTIASNSLLVVIAGWLICWLLFPLFRMFSVIGDNVVCFLLLLCLTSFNYVFMQLLRGIGKSKAFAANGVVITFVTAFSNVLALAVWHLGVGGYLASMVVAQFIGALHIIVSCRLWNYLAFSSLNRHALNAMLTYCIPLIPNSLMWWIMSASDRYVILFFIGASANGIYNVAQKIPQIVNIVYNIFMQAWQISAIEERESADNARFQSTVFRYIFVVLAVASSLIAATAYPVYTFLMSSSYEGSWQPVAMLSLANLFSCVAAFFGTTYVVTKESKKAFSTTAIGAIVNIALTLLLVPAFGIMGAAGATAISYAVIAAVRARDTRKFIKLDFHRGEIAASFILIGAQVALSFAPFSHGILIAEFLLLFALLFVLRNGLLDIARKGMKVVGKRKQSA